MGDGGAERRVRAAGTNQKVVGTERVLMAFKAMWQDHISLLSVLSGDDSLGVFGDMLLAKLAAGGCY